MKRSVPGRFIPLIAASLFVLRAPLAGALQAQEPPTGEVVEASPDEAPRSLLEALTSGTTSLDFRYRFEAADVSSLPERAWASTLRTALGYETAPYRGLSGFIEFESIDNIFGDSYNDTINGKTRRAVVADPDATEVNQAFLRVDAADDLELRLGRQEISLGNDRFVGAVPWRQNHQSFDAARALYEASDAVTLNYALSMQVNRVFGDESIRGDEQLRAHFLDARIDGGEWGDFAAYGMLVDFEDSRALSARTIGARASNTHDLEEELGADVEVGWAVEYAQQDDAADNPIDLDQDYLFLEGHASLDRFRLTVASETLGGSGRAGDKFSTPFATLHKFNGFADVFLNTPDTGLEDVYVQLATSLDLEHLHAPITLAATYHTFSADSGGADYGDEFDINVATKLSERSVLGLRYADFNGDDGFPDVTRVMAWVTFRLM